MIVPNIDVENSTEEQLIAAYIAEGMSRHSAEVYSAVLKNPDSRFPVD